MVVSRRATLLGAALTAAGFAGAEDLEVREVGSGAARFVLCTPRHLQDGERVPLLVLLHGLGETASPRLGMYAWIEKYGLSSAYSRVRRAPVAQISSRDDWGASRLAVLNADLAARPFRGLALACPYLPRNAPLDAYAKMLCDEVIPRARVEAPVLQDPAHTGLDGCSLGGFVGLEVFLRRPDAFGAWGGVQTAMSERNAESYAERIARAVRGQPRKLHLVTSSADPYRRANEALAAALAQRAIAHELVVRPGPHDQPWLRESGAVEMLLWHDRALR